MVAKTVLDKIMLYKREELPRRKRERAEADLRAALLLAPAPRDFEAARRAAGGGGGRPCRAPCSPHLRRVTLRRRCGCRASRSSRSARRHHPRKGCSAMA